jgi:hypothetical protein
VALTSSYTKAHSKLDRFFREIRDKRVPERFKDQFLRELGFKSNIHKTYIPILKNLGFLTSDGKPTSRYMDFRNHSQSRVVMAEALKEAYADIFAITAYPTITDCAAIEEEFKRHHNCCDNVAKNMRHTFYSLLAQADRRSIKMMPIVSKKRFFLYALLLACLVPALAFINPLFAIVALPFCFMSCYYPFNAISKMYFHMEFNPPTFIGTKDPVTLSDYMLFLPFIFMALSMFFIFGELADYISNKNIFKFF